MLHKSKLWMNTFNRIRDSSVIIVTTSLLDLHFLNCVNCLGILLNFFLFIFKWTFMKIWSVQQVWRNSSIVTFSVILSNTAPKFQTYSFSQESEWICTCVLRRILQIYTELHIYHLYNKPDLVKIHWLFF